MTTEFKAFKNLGLNTRIANILLGEGIDSIEKLAELDFLDILKIPRIGMRSCKLIYSCLNANKR